MSLTLMLTYPFMQRALIAGTLVSLCAALLGVPLVLKRYSMIGDGLSHVSFGALAIAVALSHSPRLLVLDEATSGLDPMVRDEVLDVFNEFTRDETHTVVLSSHIVSDLEKICDYIAFLHKGKLILFEEKDQLLEEYAIVKLSPAGPIRSGWREAGPLWGRGPGQTEPDSRRLRHRAHHLRRYHPLFGQNSNRNAVTPCK